MRLYNKNFLDNFNKKLEEMFFFNICENFLENYFFYNYSIFTKIQFQFWLFFFNGYQNFLMCYPLS